VSFTRPILSGHEEIAMKTPQVPQVPQTSAPQAIEQLLSRDLAAWRLAKDAIAKAARLTP
jgi:hypothetical protein